MTNPTQPAQDVTSEMLVTLPLPHGFTYAGLADAIEDGVLIDDKSTSDPEGYARGLPLRRQADCYALAAIAAGHNVTDVRYRIVARPKLSMKSAPKPTIKQRKTETDEEFAARVAEWQADHPAETESEYEERCFEWLTGGENRLIDVAIHLNPDRLDGASKWLAGRSNVARMLIVGEDAAHMNPSACSRHGRQCEYADLCLAKINGSDPEDIIAARWPDSPAPTPHPELPLPHRDDPNVLTFSSFTVLDDCEQRFVWRYLRGLRRVTDEAEPEALRVGTLYHKGREVYRDTGSVDLAIHAIDALGDDAPPAFADEQRKQREQVMKARAMLRASAIKWPVENQWEVARSLAERLTEDIRAHDEIPLTAIIARARELTARIDRMGASLDAHPAGVAMFTAPEQPPADLPF